MYAEQDVYALLDGRRIAYETIRHEAVFTVEQAQALHLFQGDGHNPVPCKNLFLRDDKKRGYYLVTMSDSKRVDLKRLAARIPSRRLSFASVNELADMLGLIPGAVTPLGVLNDTLGRVTTVLDEELRDRWVDVHPLVNTATVQLDVRDLVALLEEFGHAVLWRDLSFVDAGED